jgi:hypothetical protein
MSPSNVATEVPPALPIPRRQVKISLSTIPSLILIALVSLVQSYLLRDHTLVGDGIAYSSTFDALRGTGLLDGYEIFQDGIGASEFFSYTVFYVAAQVMNYDAFVYVTNLGLAYAIYAVYRHYGKNAIWFLATVPLNFYFLAVCFGAQRLKLGFLFLMLMVCASRSSRAKVLATLSLFSHFQLIIIFIAERIRSFFSGATKLPITELVAIAAVCASIFFTVPVLQLKVLSYILERGEVNLVTFAASFLVVLYVSRFDLGIVAEFLFFLAVILIIGESRVNILVFCVMWRLVFLARERPALVSYIISLYLSVKGVNFMIDILNGGTGFGVP